MDKKDRAILDELKQNSRQSWKEIGKKVFLSGQAVGARIQELKDRHIINKFTIKENYPSEQFITIYMDCNRFELFESRIHTFPQVISFYKITGDGCYFIHSHFNANELDVFLQLIAQFGRYKVSHGLKALIS
ncbi:AsnC family transcriptional regulator [Orbaceae bacterium ac157xtp]